MNFAKELAHGLAHLFFPHTCVGCGDDLVSIKQLLCLKCTDQLPLTGFESHAGNPVEKIFYGRIPLVSAMSLFYFTKDSVLQQLLHQFKYAGNKEVGYYFGRMTGKAIRQSGRFNDVDAIVPLPLYISKERKRGYNQAAVLGEGIATAMQIPVINNAIMRLSATDTQTHKNRVERWQNIAGKFKLNDNSGIEYKHVLLVDDVVTTGATLEICALELLRATGCRVSIAALAYTMD
jgi:ComF family protein